MVITGLPSAMLGRKMDGQSKTWQSHTPVVKEMSERCMSH